jgi:hypothetical protein
MPQFKTWKKKSELKRPRSTKRGNFPKNKLRRTTKERLIESVIKIPGKLDAPCWIWLKSKFDNGYGQQKIKGKNYRVHRLSYRLFVGEIPKGLLICHKCDQKDCINPEHLFLGTQADNMLDMVQKGRSLKGNKHPLYGKHHSDEAKLKISKAHKERRALKAVI